MPIDEKGLESKRKEVVKLREQLVAARAKRETAAIEAANDVTAAALDREAIQLQQELAYEKEIAAVTQKDIGKEAATAASAAAKEASTKQEPVATGAVAVPQTVVEG